MRGVSWRTEGSKENLNRRRQRRTKGNQDRRSGMGLQQIPVWACNNLTFMCGAAPRLAFCLPPHHHKTGSLKRDTHTFVSFATFCSSPLLPFCEKPGLAFRDHHWLAQTRKLCVYFLCYLLFKCRFVSPRKLFAIAACKSSCSRSAFERRSG